ncbi:MAG: ATP-binding protein [Agitococcus sp.]|nr:ATP-binding protein [Agitococcus sp.]
MKIKKLLFNDLGPLGTQEISLQNDWDDSIEARVLFTGANGCGKSTVLRSVAMLWEAVGYWLDYRKPLPKNHIAREWLQRWGGCAVILEGIPNTHQPIGLFFGERDWIEKLSAKESSIEWMGEGISYTEKNNISKRALFLPESKWLNDWADARKKMILSFEKSSYPNVVFLDAEERRWVQPKRNVGEAKADDSSLRWLPRYIASDDWKGQLEASLITLKTTQLHTYHSVIRQLNEFLAGKEIDPDIKAGENRLRVKLKGQRGQSHTLDELSAGEHQVLILIYLLARWAEEGCVVLIDEPDLYLHPSLVSVMLANLEKMVAEKHGQLIMTSHQPEIWQRYEASGKRIELGAKE